MIEVDETILIKCDPIVFFTAIMFFDFVVARKIFAFFSSISDKNNSRKNYGRYRPHKIILESNPKRTASGPPRNKVIPGAGKSRKKSNNKPMSKLFIKSPESPTPNGHCFCCGKEVEEGVSLCKECLPVRIKRLSGNRDEIEKSIKLYNTLPEADQLKYVCCPVCGMAYLSDGIHNTCPACFDTYQELNESGKLVEHITTTQRTRVRIYEDDFDEDLEEDLVTGEDTEEDTEPELSPAELKRLEREQRKEERRIAAAEKKFLNEEKKKKKRGSTSGYSGC